MDIEEVVYFCVVVASATFVIKTIVGWIHSARYEKDRSCRKAEQIGRREAYLESRIENLEKEVKNTKDIDLW